MHRRPTRRVTYDLSLLFLLQLLVYLAQTRGTVVVGIAT
jgi:hypothetical protein